VFDAKEGQQMRHKTLFVGCALLLGALLVGSADLLHGEQAGGKTIKVKLLLPDPEGGFFEPLKVLVDGKEVPGEGVMRTITVTTPQDKDYVTITAIWEPNNYTKISRPRKVVAMDGEVTADFRNPSKTEKDDIVVRFVPTPNDVVAAMCKMAKIGKDDIVYDLGCGDGRMVIMSVKDFGAKKGVGVDLNPELVKGCQESAKAQGVSDKVTFRVGDVLKVDDLSDASVVLLYMGDDINERLKPILKKTLKPGSRVVSHRFLMGDDWPPDRTETVNSSELHEPLIHLWVIKKQ